MDQVFLNLKAVITENIYIARIIISLNNDCCVVHFMCI